MERSVLFLICNSRSTFHFTIDYPYVSYYNCKELPFDPGTIGNKLNPSTPNMIPEYTSNNKPSKSLDLSRSSIHQRNEIIEVAMFSTSR
ncbi:hypothetical protein L2E82_16447 [Cichorium intybus]|uniref:Uncharacterized protein n=1 Tax=Cichorium intybus TaxID=13427 RepID=A0ACB9F628_CICIN|nr:hypothetical protein L2E82_16447 [Cichorium intybus]